MHEEQIPSAPLTEYDKDIFDTNTDTELSEIRHVGEVMQIRSLIDMLDNYRHLKRAVVGKQITHKKCTWLHWAKQRGD